MRGAFFIVVNGLSRLDELGTFSKRLARVQVPVEAREIAAGYLDSDFVAGQESIACHPQVDLVTINLAGLNEARIALQIAAARARDAVAEIEWAPVRMGARPDEHPEALP